MCDSYPDFENIKVVRGRKDYRCVECRRVMPAGEQHESYSGKWEGDFATYRTCIPCRDLRERLRPIVLKDVGEDCFTFGELGETVTGYVAWDGADGGASVLCGHPHFTRDKFRPKAWGADPRCTATEDQRGSNGGS